MDDIIANMTKERKPRAKSRHLEDNLHLEVVRYLRAVIGREGVCHINDVLWFSLEPRARRSLGEGARNKARGVIAGVPDIVLIHRGAIMFIELKSVTGKVSPEQEFLHCQIESALGQCAVCRSLGDVQLALLGFSIPTREAR